MKAALVALALVGLAFGAHAAGASTTSIFTTAQAVEAAAEQELSELLSLVDSKKDAGLERKRGDEQQPVRVAARYVVAPDEARAFVEIFERRKDAALKLDGTVAFRLFKTLDDNVTFLFTGVWKSIEDLKEHLKSDETLDFLKDLAEHKVIFKTTRVIEVAQGSDRSE